MLHKSVSDGSVTWKRYDRLKTFSWKSLQNMSCFVGL